MTHILKVCKRLKDLLRCGKSLKQYLPESAYACVEDRMLLQLKNAKEWRDVINTYFARKTSIPDMKGRVIYGWGDRQVNKQAKAARKYRNMNYLRRSWMLYLMLLIPIAYFILFKYVPMTNIVIAFKDYNMFKGTWESPWAGLKWFQKAFSSRDFFNAVRNTFVLKYFGFAGQLPCPNYFSYIT